MVASEQKLEYNKKRYYRIRERLLLEHREYYMKNKVSLNQKNKQYAEANKEKIAAWQTNYRATHREKICAYNRKYTKTVSGRFRGYIAHAKTRGVVFELTLEDFIGLWGRPCHYCGDKIDAVGIDRIDSKLGYTLSNVCPCCAVCNRMKLHHSVDFFLAQCEKIYTHRDNMKGALRIADLNAEVARLKAEIKIKDETLERGLELCASPDHLCKPCPDQSARILATLSPVSKKMMSPVCNHPHGFPFEIVERVGTSSLRVIGYRCDCGAEKPATGKEVA